MRYRTIIVGMALVLSPLVLLYLRANWILYSAGCISALGALVYTLRVGRRSTVRARDVAGAT